MAEKMIAYCGLDCAKCDAYIATQTEDKALLEKTAKLWSEWNKVEIRPEDVYCDGCRSNGRKSAYFCQVKRCAESKSLIHCGYCLEMEECAKIRPFLESNAEIKDNLKV